MEIELPLDHTKRIFTMNQFGLNLEVCRYLLIVFKITHFYTNLSPYRTLIKLWRPISQKLLDRNCK